MEHTRFVGLDIHKDLDIHKERISIAVAARWTTSAKLQAADVLL